MCWAQILFLGWTCERDIHMPGNNLLQLRHNYTFCTVVFPGGAYIKTLQFIFFSATIRRSATCVSGAALVLSPFEVALSGSNKADEHSPVASCGPWPTVL